MSESSECRVSYPVWAINDILPSDKWRVVGAHKQWSQAWIPLGKGRYKCIRLPWRIWVVDMVGEGLIHECHCANCGANITYYIDLNPKDEDDNEKV